MDGMQMKYPIGVQDFERLREDGYVYVDKTRHVYDIAMRGNSYFLGRPRRFGKSLLLSTFEAYFMGKKDLFKGLAIEKLETEWTEYPVLRLDLNTGQYTDERGLESVINNTLLVWEKTYGSMESEDSLPLRFKGAITRAYEKTGRQVVVLVDEYDKPLLNTFENPELQEKYRSQLKAFYSVLKTQNRYIRFAFLTGVTKFGKVSVFSDLNNLNDISMDRRYVDVCGISERELHEYFDEPIKCLAQTSGKTYEEVCKALKEKYDGYHFESDTVGIYNPFSLLNALDKMKIGDWWYETGTPTFLVQLLKGNDYDLNDLYRESLTQSDLRNVDNVMEDPIPVMYQSGYLTIKGYNAEFNTYQLGFPNAEVETGFMQSLLPHYLPLSVKRSRFSVSKFVGDVRRGDPEGFMTRLQAFLSDGDYRVAGDKEIYFQNVLFVAFKMIGLYTTVERITACGRADIVIETAGYVYIIECKLDGSVDEALRQIEEKGYAKPYQSDSRQLFKIGVNFSSKIRGIAEWRVQ